MKKLIISLSLAAILIFGIFGGVALAATPPDDSPKGMWETIIEKLGDIYAYINEVNNQVHYSRIENGMIMNDMVKMYTDSESYEFQAASGTEAYFFDPIDYDGEIRHVSLTLLTLQLIQPQDSVAVIVYEETQPYYIYAMREGDLNAGSVEFDATKWGIRIRDERGAINPQAIQASCYWTETYPKPD